MSKQFFIYQNPNQAPRNTNWIEMDGHSFYQFINSQQARNRFFISLPSLTGESNDPEITIEASEAEYIKWRKEKRHEQYLRDCAKDIIVFSYHAMMTEDLFFGNNDLPEAVEAILLYENLYKALTLLSADERWLIDELLLSKSVKSGRELSRTTGIPQKTISNRYISALKKLKLNMAQN